MEANAPEPETPSGEADWSGRTAALGAGFSESSDEVDSPIRPGSDPAYYAAYQAPVRSAEPDFASPPDVPASHDPPLGLEGYCPVTINEKEQWTEGEARWTAMHRGRAYRMADAARYDRFRLTPERYAPVLSGDDPVSALDQGRRIAGQSEHCVVYEGRLYMFSSETSLARFRQNPRHYATMARTAP